MCIKQDEEGIQHYDRKRGFQELGRSAANIPDSEADNALEKLSLNISEDLSREVLRSAIKTLFASKKDLKKDVI